MEAEDERPEFWVKCRACAFCWVAAYLPISVDRFAKIARGSRCPKCAAGGVIVAKQENGKLLEPKT